MDRRARASQKRRRLTAAAARVLHEQGIERTTLADIAREADVPVGNVYYYFKTKDELVQAALSEHRAHLDELTAELDQLPTPRDRLKALVEAWVAQRDTAARHGCPTGTLAVELDKRADGTLDAEAGAVIRRLLDWTAAQFRTWGIPAPRRPRPHPDLRLPGHVPPDQRPPRPGRHDPRGHPPPAVAGLTGSRGRGQ